MNDRLGELSSFWSQKTSIFTRLGAVVQLTYIAALVIIIPILLIEFEFINWWWVAVVMLAMVSVFFSFSGRRNLGFLIAIVSILLHFIQAAVNGSWSMFTVEWEVVFSRELPFHNYLFLGSLFLLPLASVLLIIGRPEWKLLKGKA
jgi:hypothetical protein